MLIGRKLKDLFEKDRCDLTGFESKVGNDDKLKNIFEKGRCKDAVKRNLYDCRDKIDPDEYIDPMVSERIKKRCLRCPKLSVLKRYINRTAYTEMIRMLIDEGILPKGKCGNCVYLSNSELLIGRKLKDIFEKGRCDPSVMVKDAVKRNLYDYRDKIEPAEYIEQMTFEISERIKEQCLRCPKLPVLKGYINRTAYTEVIRMLIEEGELLKGECGNCVHLSKAKPYICQGEYIRMKGEETKNSEYGKRKNPSSRSCKGFEPPPPPEPLPPDETVPPEPPEPPDETVILLETMKKSLAKRIESAENKNEKRKYERQHIVFCRFASLFYEGSSERDALKKISKELGVSLRTIRRYLKEIREFLETEMSSEAQ